MHTSIQIFVILKLQNHNSEKYNALVTVITGMIWSVKFNCHLFSTRTTINAQKKSKNNAFENSDIIDGWLSDFRF